MARSYARIKTAIWSAPDFLGLSAAAQRLYHLVLEQPDLSLCGVIAPTVGRWAAMAKDTTPAIIRRALTELVAGEEPFVVVDEITEELWVRTFAVHDINYGTPGAVIAMARDFAAIRSPIISDGFLDGIPHDMVYDFLDKHADDKRYALDDAFLDAFLARAPALHQPPTTTSTTTTTAAFAEFWEVYPRRVGKQAARRAFAKASVAAGPVVVLEGARRFAADPNLPRDDPQFIPHPQTWLNQGRWEDDPLPSRFNNNGKPTHLPPVEVLCVGCGVSLAQAPAFKTQEGPKCETCAA